MTQSTYSICSTDYGDLPIIDVTHPVFRGEIDTRFEKLKDKGIIFPFLVERAVGFEPTKCQDGSLVPFRLATPAQEWSREWDLNPRSRDYRSRALPVELSLELRNLVPGAGVEPA